jgi:hypothetical protein
MDPKPAGTVSTTDATGQVCVDTAGEDDYVSHNHRSASAQSVEEIIATLGERFRRPELITLQELATVRSLPRLQKDFKDLNLVFKFTL